MSARSKVPGSHCPACCHEARRDDRGGANDCPWVDELLEVFCAGLAGPQTRNLLTMLAPCATGNGASESTGPHPDLPPTGRHLRLM